MSHAKGDRWERNYRNAINAEDPDEDADDAERVGLTVEDFITWKAIRIPASGAASTDDLPDLHIWHTNGHPDDPNPTPTVELQFAAESKAFPNDGGTSIEYEEVEALRRHARSTGAVPVVFAHVDYVGDFVFHVDELHDTGSKYSIRAKRDVEDGSPRTFAEFVRNPFEVA